MPFRPLDVDRLLIIELRTCVLFVPGDTVIEASFEATLFARNDGTAGTKVRLPGGARYRHQRQLGSTSPQSAPARERYLSGALISCNLAGVLDGLEVRYLSRICGPQKFSTLRSWIGAGQSGHVSFFNPRCDQTLAMCSVRQGRHVLWLLCWQAGSSACVGNSEFDSVQRLLAPQARHLRVYESTGDGGGLVAAGRMSDAFVSAAGSG